MNSYLINKLGSRSRTMLCLPFLLSTTAIVAQTDDADEEIFTLTPFEVTADKNEGYRATSTLAGTRMRMSLDDVGSSVSVFTEQLMEDLGAVDNETLLTYGLGLEVGGARGNFINATSGGLENENLVDPQSNNRIRGLTSADSTRNYFKSDVPWDGYNTNRIDVQRGANSILFGLGSPAGIINNTTESAVFNNEGDAKISFDKFGSLRTSFGLNREIIEDELAVRLNILRDEKKYRQDPAYEDDERIHAAVLYQPKALNGEKTLLSFSADFESGKITANRPRMVIPLDNVSSFFIPSNENGFQGADFANGAVYGPSQPIFGPGGQTYNTVADNTALDSIPWLDTLNSTFPVFAFDASDPSQFSVYQNGLSSQGSFLTLESGEESAVVVNSGYVNPFATNANNTFIRDVNGNVYNYRPLTSNGKQSVADNNGLAFPGFWRDASLSSTDQFDFVNNLIDGNNKLEQQEFDVLELRARNTFLNNRLGYQISYFNQKLSSRQDANTGAIYAPSISVEANTFDPLSDNLANPLANPNAGRAYIDYELRLAGGREDVRDREATQLQLFATLDTQDFMDDSWLSRTLGRHDFITMFKNSQYEQLRREFNSIGPDEQTLRAFGGLRPDDQTLNPAYNARNSDPGAGARRARLSNAFGDVQSRIRVYLESEGPNLTQLQPFDDIILPSGSYNYRGFSATPVAGFTAEDALEEWIDPNGNTLTQDSNPANYVGTVANRGTVGIVHATDSAEALEYLTTRRFFDEEEVDTTALVWSGTMLDKAFVGMYGWRKDEVTQRSLEHEYSNISANDVIGRTGGDNFNTNSSFVRDSSGEFQSRNWSAKLDATKLFFDLTGMDDEWLPFNISFLYNEGQVQNPQPGRRDVLLKDLEPATGSTIDRSVAISSKDGRYSLRYTSFDTRQQNANAGGVAASENWRIEQVMANSVGSGVVWIEEGRSAYTDAVLDNGDDIDDDGEINPGRSQQIRDAGFDDVYEWGQFIAAAYRDFENELFTTYPETMSWITSGAPGTNSIGINFPDDTVFIEDNRSFGQELEFTARPTDNWNITFNASKTEVLRSKVFGDEVNEVLDLIVGALSGPAGTVPLWGPEGQFGRDRVAPFLGQLITNRALLGTPTGELRKWKLNMVTGYNFTDGALDGLGVGVGLRYEDSQVIGFPPIYVDPVTGEQLPDRSRPDAALSVDLSSPYRDKTRTTADLWFNYGRPLNDKIDWRIQLNIFNVGDDKGTVPLFVNPDGSIGTRGIREGRSWQVSNSFTF